MHIILIWKALLRRQFPTQIKNIKFDSIICNNHQYLSECSPALLREAWEYTYEPVASHVGLGTMWNAMATFYGPTFSDPHCIFMLTSSDFTGSCVISKLLYGLWWNERFPIIGENSGFAAFTAGPSSRRPRWFLCFTLDSSLVTFLIFVWKIRFLSYCLYWT